MTAKASSALCTDDAFSNKEGSGEKTDKAFRCSPDSVLAMGTGMVISIYQSKNNISVSVYTLSSPLIIKDVRIAQLSDLHNAEFGDGNSRLIEKVKAQEPDMIFLTGDMVSQSEKEYETVTQLISELVQIVPVYASLGNHEEEYREEFGVDIVKICTDAGAVVLDKAYVDIEINGQPIRLGGITGYCLAEQYLKSGEAK